MGVNATGDRTAGSSSTLPETTASELIVGVGAGQSFNAQSILRRNPEAAEERSTVVDLAYEEYCRRKDSGESLDIHAFASRFPDIEQSLIRVLEVHEYLEQNPDSTFDEFVPQWPELGDEFLGFLLIAELGRGAFSRVFLAEEAALGNRQVVVKVCEYANGEPAKLGQLKHSNIVPVHSVQTQVPGGLTAICMPFLANATLQDVLEDAFRDEQQPVRGSLILATAERTNRLYTPPEEDDDVPWAMRSGSYGDAVIELGAQICDALAFAHQRGILHCDIKPSNVLLTAEGRSKLFDFNLSRQQGGDEQTVGGTLPYMAPEQVQCLIDAKIDLAPPFGPRTDLFSLGVTLFQLLTGKLPFEVNERTESKRRDARELLDKQRAGAVSVAELERVVNPRTARLILSCLAFEPEARPRSAESLAHDLRVSLAPLARAKRWVQTHKILTIAMVLILCAASEVFAYHLAMQPSTEFSVFRDGIVRMEGGEYLEAADQFNTVMKEAGELADEAAVMKRLSQVRWVHGEFTEAFDLFNRGEFSGAVERCTGALEVLKRRDFADLAPYCAAAFEADGFDAQKAEPDAQVVAEFLLLRGVSRWAVARGHAVDGKDSPFGIDARDDFVECKKRWDNAYARVAMATYRNADEDYTHACDDLARANSLLARANSLEFASVSVLNNLAVLRLRKTPRDVDALKLLVNATKLARDQQELARDQQELELLYSNLLVRAKKCVSSPDPLKKDAVIASAIAYIKLVPEDLPASHDTEYAKAYIYLSAHRAELEKPPGPMEYLEQTLTSLKRALELGLHPEILKGKSWSILQSNEQFKKLSNPEKWSKDDRKPLADDQPVLLDMFPDIIERLVPAKNSPDES